MRNGRENAALQVREYPAVTATDSINLEYAGTFSSAAFGIRIALSIVKTIGGGAIAAL